MLSFTSMCYISAVMAIVFAIFTTVGSILIMLTVLTSKTLRRHHRNWVLIGILFADFLMGVFALPLVGELFFNLERWQHTCELAPVVYGYAYTAVPFITLWCLVLLSLDHLIREACSLKPESSPLTGIVMALVPWLGMGVFVIPLASQAIVVHDYPSCQFTYEQSFLIAQSTISCFLPSAILLVTVPLMIISRKNPPPSDDPDHKSLLIDKDFSSQRAGIAPIVASSVVSVLLLMPSQILFAMPSDVIMSFVNFQTVQVIWLVLTFITWFATCVFPYLWLSDPNIRKELKAKVCCQKGSPIGKTTTAEYSKFSQNGSTDEVKLG